MPEAVTTPIPAAQQWSLFGIKSDQWAFILTSVLTVFGTLLASWGLDHDTVDLILGAVSILVAVAIAIWLNGGNVWDQVLAALHKLLEIVGVFAVARGWVSNEQVAQYSGVVITVATLAWQMLHYSATPGLNLPGTTIADTKADVDAAKAASASG